MLRSPAPRKRSPPSLLQVAVGVDLHRIAHECRTLGAPVVCGEAVIRHLHLGQPREVLLRRAGRSTARRSGNAAQPVELPLRNSLRLIACRIDATLRGLGPRQAELFSALLPVTLLTLGLRPPPGVALRVG